MLNLIPKIIRLHNYRASAELNGDDCNMIPIKDERVDTEGAMQIGYIMKKRIPSLSKMAELYIKRWSISELKLNIKSKSGKYVIQSLKRAIEIKL